MDDITALTAEGILGLSDEDLRSTVAEVLVLQRADRKESQLLYYTPVSAAAEKIHFSKAAVVGVGGGNRSAKTETCMVELIALATGIFPLKYQEIFREKFRGPVMIRIVVKSFTTVLHPIILPKLQWWKWTGIDSAGGDRGHWGWVPKSCLIDGSWDKSWSEHLRTLRVLCRDPDDTNMVTGESVIQFMSKDQDPESFASGTFHHILHDEPPELAQYVENEARVLDVAGRIMLAMTWPDDPSIPVDWIYDRIYEPGIGSDPNVDWFVLNTLDNKFLDRQAVLDRTTHWTAEQKSVRLEGGNIRFSNRVHPLFTDSPNWWCFVCGKVIYQNLVEERHVCGDCGSSGVVEYCHLKTFDHSTVWPVVFMLDPHPRKPHMFCWVQVDPSDDLWVVAEGEVEGDPVEVREYTEKIEENMGLNVSLRLMDPNMGASPSSAKRGVTWEDEFGDAGLRCALADDSAVGRMRVNDYLKPDQHRLQPRLHVHTRCEKTRGHMMRYAWGEFKKSADRDVKQTPRDKYDDYPSLLKYLLNYEPTFAMLHHGAPVIKRPGKRRGVY